ncbi:hypothetical protein NQ315_013121 [Exocentrus adspersus]|uniref:G-protein coupled receptors family 1 profile domain-containing protein n=1 Tax=Exocentrus adspersus TaxID=1586481 RepID=A0AAV8VWV3_9CUCU|nr:hypothetical protein NQ315_013121 [Exocentrus adspersus]
MTLEEDLYKETDIKRGREVSSGSLHSKLHIKRRSHRIKSSLRTSLEQVLREEYMNIFWMGKAVPFVELTVAHASVLTILAISFERYYAICKPLKAGYICTKARASLICLLAWFVAAVFTSYEFRIEEENLDTPPGEVKGWFWTLHWLRTSETASCFCPKTLRTEPGVISSPLLGIAEFKQVEYFDGSKVPACHTLANTFWSALYFLSIIFLFFILPLIILLVLYCIIAKNLISNAATMVLNKHIDNYSIRARRQVILMLGTVVLSFFLCLIPFRVFTLWIIIVPEENVYHLGAEKYYNILYFCRIMVYLNSAINPILYNLMSSKFRSGFIICSEARRRLYFKRSRNGTFSTTTTTRSSTTRSSHDGYKVCYRPRNNSILIKNCNDSPDSNRSSDSHSMFRGSPGPRNLRSLRNSSKDEEFEDLERRSSHEKADFNVFTERVAVNRSNLQKFLDSKCFKETEERISLHEKFSKQRRKHEEESFVPILAITQYGPEEYWDGSIVFVCFSLVEDLLPCVFFIGSVVIFFILPLAILICVYALIAKSLMTHPTTAVTAIRSTTVPSQSVIKYRKQVIMMLGTVVVAFFICLLPFRALTLWIIVAPAGSSFEIGFENYYNILFFSRIMLYINSAVNPILYNVMSSKFRGGFFKLCGLKSIKRRYRRRPEITRKSTTSSSAHTTSQQTSDTNLKGSRSHSSRYSSSLKEVKELPGEAECSTSQKRGNLVKNAYIRAPLDIANSICGQKLPNGEIFL